MLMYPRGGDGSPQMRKYESSPASLKKPQIGIIPSCTNRSTTCGSHCMPTVRATAKQLADMLTSDPLPTPIRKDDLLPLALRRRPLALRLFRVAEPGAHLLHAGISLRRTAHLRVNAYASQPRVATPRLQNATPSAFGASLHLTISASLPIRIYSRAHTQTLSYVVLIVCCSFASRRA